MGSLWRVGRPSWLRRGQPDMRLDTYAAIVQLTVETFDVRLERRSFKADGQIANACVEQSLIRDEAPFESRRRQAHCSAGLELRARGIWPYALGNAPAACSWSLNERSFSPAIAIQERLAARCTRIPSASRVSRRRFEFRGADVSEDARAPGRLF